jgi:hypothetical protein
VQRLVPQARCVGAELPGALQTHGALVEAARQHHLPVQPAQRAGADARRAAVRPAVFIEELVAGDAESDDGGLHAFLR